MKLLVRSATEYTYDHAPRRSTQYLRVTPKSGSGQTVTDWRISAPGRLASWTDMFGNLCHSLSPETPGASLRIEVEGLVETNDTAGIEPHEPGTLPLAMYLRTAAYTALDATLRDYANGWQVKLAANRLDGLHGLMTDIHKKVVYTTDATNVMTTAAEAFGQGSGVCQDHAHVLIAVCRHLDIPARYVSGYLWTGSDNETYGASHAWAECWVDDLGWVSFDPANGVSATDKYVRVAVGFDYATAGPVQGVRVGGGGESMKVEVQLQSADAQAQQ